MIPNRETDKTKDSKKDENFEYTKSKKDEKSDGTKTKDKSTKKDDKPDGTQTKDNNNKMDDKPDDTNAKIKDKSTKKDDKPDDTQIKDKNTKKDDNSDDANVKDKTKTDNKSGTAEIKDKDRKKDEKSDAKAKEGEEKDTKAKNEDKSQSHTKAKPDDQSKVNARDQSDADDKFKDQSKANAKFDDQSDVTLTGMQKRKNKGGWSLGNSTDKSPDKQTESNKLQAQSTEMKGDKIDATSKKTDDNVRVCPEPEWDLVKDIYLYDSRKAGKKWKQIAEELGYRKKDVQDRWKNGHLDRIAAGPYCPDSEDEDEPKVVPPEALPVSQDEKLLQMKADGKSMKDIASELGLSKKVVQAKYKELRSQGRDTSADKQNKGSGTDAGPLNDSGWGNDTGFDTDFGFGDAASFGNDADFGNGDDWGNTVAPAGSDSGNGATWDNKANTCKGSSKKNNADSGNDADIDTDADADACPASRARRARMNSYDRRLMEHIAKFPGIENFRDRSGYKPASSSQGKGLDNDDGKEPHNNFANDADYSNANDNDNETVVNCCDCVCTCHGKNDRIQGENHINEKNQKKYFGKGRLTVDSIWSKRDVDILEGLEDGLVNHKWMHMQAEFYNWTGRMIQAEIIEQKFKDDGAWR